VKKIISGKYIFRIIAAVLSFYVFSLTTFTVWALIGLAVFGNWKDKPDFLKDAVWIVVPLIILSLFMGYLDELRYYYELFPIVFLLITANIGRILGVKIEAYGIN